MGFMVVKRQDKAVQLSVTLNEDQVAVLSKAGEGLGVSAEEVAAQFLVWGIESKALQPAPRKRTKKSKVASPTE